nr:B3 domain-containing protein, DNA-binding pseudobarrel domain protein [Tanacetum cinerariifolium]
MQTSTTQEYPSLIDTFFIAHTVNGEFLWDEDRRIYEEMRRLEPMGTYTDDEINRLARGGKQRGHIASVGRVLPVRATASPSMPAHDSTLNSLHKKVDFMMSIFKSDSKYSDMFSQFESGGASGSGGCGDEEEGADHQDDEDKEGDDPSDWNTFQKWYGWFFSIRFSSKSKSLLEGTFFVAWWNIWRIRNRIIFEGVLSRRSEYDVSPISMNFLDLHDYCGFDLDHLEYFEMESFGNSPSEMELVKLIMAKSPALKKVRLELTFRVSVDEEFKILRLPRASSSAMLVIERKRWYSGKVLQEDRYWWMLLFVFVKTNDCNSGLQDYKFLIQVFDHEDQKLRREETPRIVGNDSARSEPTEVADSNDFKPLLKEKRLKEQTGKGILVPLLGPTLTMYAEPMKLKIWPMGGTHYYVLMNKWNSFVEENKDYLKQLSTIQLWSFHVEQQLCFALVVVERPLANGVDV